MRVKHILVIIILTVLITIIGELFILMHWPFQANIILIATLFKIVSGVLIIRKILTTDKFKDFLNS